MSWRNLSFALAALCLYQLWQSCTRTSSELPVADAVDCPAPSSSRPTWTSSSSESTTRERPSVPASGRGFSLYGFQVPPWAMGMVPQRGENLRAYRDRMLPLAQMAAAPHRARLTRSRDDLAARIGLDAQQRAELDTATQETATAIQDRVMNAVLSGELAPSTFKPMAGVTVARDLLDVIDRGNRRFHGALRDDQRAQLAEHPFDFAEYLLFATRWEDAISGL